MDEPVIKYQDGKIIEKAWYKNGILHRENDEPAFIQYPYAVELIKKTWYKDGKCYRENDKPTHIIYHTDGEIHSERWVNENGSPHRENDKPAIIRYDKNTGRVVEKEWYNNGQIYRSEDKPNVIQYNIDGKITYTRWDIIGIRSYKHNLYSIEYDSNGNIKWETRIVDNGLISIGYGINGNVISRKWLSLFYQSPHQENGNPAIVEYNKDGKIINEEWFINGLHQRDNDKPAIINMIRIVGS